MINKIYVASFYNETQTLELAFEVGYQEEGGQKATTLHCSFKDSKLIKTTSLSSGYNLHEYYIACGDAFKVVKGLDGSQDIKDIFDRCNTITSEYGDKYEECYYKHGLARRELANIQTSIKESITKRNRCRKEESINEVQKVINELFEKRDKFNKDIHDFRIQLDKIRMDERMKIKSLEINI